MFYSLANMMPQSEALQPLRLTKLVLYACACREWRAERAAWEFGHLCICSVSITVQILHANIEQSRSSAGV